jgi:AcrR family transcriptional regulator
MPNRARKRDTTENMAPVIGRVVAAAVALADERGLEAVSIRRIAGELQMRPMSLYTYFPSKEALLELMGEQIVSEILIREPLPDGWREALTLIATRSHEVFTRHPWVLAISQQRTTIGRNGLRHAEQQLTALAPLALPARDDWRILFLINDYTLGHAMRVAHTPAASANTYPDFDPADYPHLAEALTQPRPARGSDTFHTGLNTILDEIERQVTQ